MKLGAQLYSVRTFTQTAVDLDATFARLKEIGYECVQLSGEGPIPAEQLSEISQKHQLPIVCSHVPIARILNDTEAVIAEHKTFGCDFIGVGSMPGGAANYQKFLDEAKLPGKKIHDAGLQFMYHNHDFEYKNVLDDNRPLMHHISDDFTAEELCFTLDTFWVKAGGYDVIEEIERLSGRLPVVHFKDMFVNENGDRLMSWVGGGNALDFEKIVPAFEAAGTELAYIEQDNCNGENPFDCLKKSYEYLKTLGLN